MPKKGNPYNLTDKQLLFGNQYLTDGCFANGFAAYCVAYDKQPETAKEIASVKSAASRLLTNVNLCKYINDLLDKNGLNDQFVDKQLLFLIQQHADFKTKLGAIKEYNSLKKRIETKLEGKLQIEVIYIGG